MKTIATIAALLIAAQKAAGESNRAGNRMLDKVREAAAIAVDSLPAADKKDVKAAHARIIAEQGEALKPCDKNVRAAFANVVLIALAPDSTIETAAPKDGKPAEFKLAAEMVSKADMVKAASQLRDEFGMRTSTKKTPKSGPVATMENKADVWLAMLPEILKVPAQVESLRAALKLQGWTMSRASVKEATKATKVPQDTARSVVPPAADLIKAVEKSIAAHH